MTLRNKILHIITVTLVALTLILWGISHMVMHAGFSRMEHQDAHRNATRVVNALQREIMAVDNKAHDWASWDDTYRFIMDRNREYLESNLVSDGFLTLDINIMLYLDASGAVVFSRGYDLETGRELTVPDRLLRLAARGDRFVRHREAESTVAGIVPLPEGLLMVASRPVLTTNGTGPIRGTLIFGRFVDGKEVARLAEITRLDVQIRYWSDPAPPEDFRAAVSALADSSAAFTLPLSSDTIAGYARIDDIYGNPCLILRSAMPREIREQERHSMWVLVVVLFTTGLGFTTVMLFFLERYVLSRLTRMSGEFRGIGARGDFSGRISPDGNDELDAVAAAGNRMLEALEQAHNRIRRRNREMRTIMDTVPIALLSLNREYRINAEYSKSAEGMFARKDLTGGILFDLIGFEREEDRDTLREYLDLLREGSLPEEDLDELNPFPEIELRRPGENSPIWVKSRYKVIHREGELSGNILAVFEDVSGEHALAEQVSRSEAEIAQVLAIAEDPGLYREFLSLARNTVRGIAEGSALLAGQPEDDGIVNGLFRMAHTLKGTTSAFGASALSVAASAMEDLLSGMREHADPPGALTGEVSRIVEELTREFEMLNARASRILGDDGLESGGMYLPVPLRELDAVSGMARQLCREGMAGKRGGDLVRALRMLRMTPAKKGLARAVRIIGDLIRRTEKDIAFHFEGREALLDCEMARALNDPLVHLFRNSLSHGIEDRGERIAIGKPERGRVTLDIRSGEGDVVLLFSDDGRGLDSGKLRETALRLGIITPGAAEKLSVPECLDLIFQPGFTTSRRVNALSGRGVGMDAVREGIRLLHGSIRVDPSPDTGVRFIIRIPASD